MNLLSAVNSLEKLSHSLDPNPIPALDNTATPFDHLIAQLLAATHPSSKPFGVADREKIFEFRRKLAFLSGMVEQARTAMVTEPVGTNGIHGPGNQEYFFWEAKLSQVGCPDGVSNTL